MRIANAVAYLFDEPMLRRAADRLEALALPALPEPRRTEVAAWPNPRARQNQAFRC
jgi:hypothetical protein